MTREHEDIRKEIWVKVYVAYVSASNSISVNGAAKWADQALKEFDSRFKEVVYSNHQ